MDIGSRVHTATFSVWWGQSNQIIQVKYAKPWPSATMLFSDRKSNRPLVTILAMEFVSRSLRRSIPPSSSLERSEYAKRDRDMLWYLFRGGIWESYTR